MRESSRPNHSAPSPAAQNRAPDGKAVQSPSLGDQPRSAATQERAVDAQQGKRRQVPSSNRGGS